MLIAVIAVPLLVVGALGNLDPVPEPSHAASPPTPSPLEAIDLLCPSPLSEDSVLAVGRAAEVDEAQTEGEIVVRVGAAAQPLDVPIGGVGVAPTPTEADVVSGSGAMAPGLIGSLAEAKPRAGSDCPSARAEQWYTGLGAGPTHASQLELVNPDESNAVADVTVYSDEGVVDVSDLRGIGVPASSSIRLNLAELLPQRGQLGLHVAVSRGRLGVFVLDEEDELGAGDVSQDWIPAQPASALTSVLLGLPTGTDAEAANGSAQQKLVVTNPGPNEAVVSLKVLTQTSAFTPAGVPELQIPPNAVGVFTLTDALAALAPRDTKKDKKDKKDEKAALEETALGLLVESSEPVASTLRSVVGGDLSFTGAAEPIEQSRVLVPEISEKERATLVLSNGPAAVTASVRFLGADGSQVGEQDVTAAESAAVEVKVPADTASISIDSPAGVSAGLLVTGPQGSLAVPVRQLLTTLLIPDVQPAIR